MEWFGKSLTNKEARLVAKYKMDAVNLTGVWPTFPSTAVSAGRLHYGAGLLLQLMEMEARSGKRRRESVEQTRRRLIDEVEARIKEEDETDLALILAL